MFIAEFANRSFNCSWTAINVECFFNKI